MKLDVGTLALVGGIILGGMLVDRFIFRKFFPIPAA